MVGKLKGIFLKNLWVVLYFLIFHIFLCFYFCIGLYLWWEEHVLLIQFYWWAGMLLKCFWLNFLTSAFSKVLKLFLQHFEYIIPSLLRTRCLLRNPLVALWWFPCMCGIFCCCCWFLNSLSLILLQFVLEKIFLETYELYEFRCPGFSPHLGRSQALFL